MKKLISLVVLILMLMGIQYFLNCADPLETSRRNGPSPTAPRDTVYSVDTVLIIDSSASVDTIYVVDTVGTVDTVMIIDTVTMIDTVIIELPGPIDSQFICSRISCNQNEIVWLLRNQPDLFRLEFAASLESDHPIQTVTIDIDGAKFDWNPAANPEFVTELNLGRNATIRITPKKPPALGHAIDICLTLTVL